MSRIGIDVGGTFTDFAVLGADGLRTHKTLSTARDPSLAVTEGLRAVDPDSLASIVHGTTVATNTLLERRGARTAFVTTEGFGDLLVLGRGARPSLYALEPRAEPALVPSSLCFEVVERVGADGRVVRALSAEEAARVARLVAAADAESVAVCLLFSYLLADHERRLGAAIQSTPSCPRHVSLSVDVLPEFREYERAATVVANAYVAPVVATYLRQLAAMVAPRSLTVMASHGGTLSPGEAARVPAATVLSGPAAGVCGAAAVAQRAGHRRIITLDMGGTSTDVALCDGDVPFTSQTLIGGLPIHLPAVDVHTVGAGGGSLVRADEAGALRVGPRSAGADPGPAAYGRGGQRATVTDAHVVLGRLPAGCTLAGGIRLDLAAARQAMGRVSSRLGLSVEEAARGAVAVANASMERALRRVSVERGFDPRDFTLVAFGGAGPLHACELAEGIGVCRVLVPVSPGTLSALGLAAAVSQATVSRSVLRPEGDEPPDYDAVFAELEAGARRSLQLSGASGTRVERLADLRYHGQSWELTVPWPSRADVESEFVAAHERRYGYSRPGAPIEIVTLRSRVMATQSYPLPAATATRGGVRGASMFALPGQTTAQALVRDRSSLAPGEAIAGPAVIAEADATTFVAADWLAKVTAHGDLELHRR